MINKFLIKLQFISSPLRRKNVKNGIGGPGRGLSLCAEDRVFMKRLLRVDRCEYMVIGIVKKGQLSLTLVHLNCNKCKYQC